MHVEPFALERWFGEYEHDADVVLAESGIRSLPASRFDTDPGDLGYVIPTDGDPTLREAIADRYDREAEEVLCTCGTQEANFLAFLALFSQPPASREGATSLFPAQSHTRSQDPHAVVITPTYQALSSVPDAFGDVTEVSLEPPAWRLSTILEAVDDAIRPETRVIVLANPNNPTGRYHPLETIEALVDLAADADAYLLCDEVYRLLADDPLPPVASRGPRGLSTTSLSKAYGLAGLRFGWLVGDRDVIEAARRWKDYTTISPPLIGQHVARQILEDHDRAAALLAENRDLAARNRERVRAFLDEYGLEWAGSEEVVDGNGVEGGTEHAFEPAGVTAFVTVPDGFETGTAFCRTVVEDASVVLAPGEYFGHPEYVRIGFGLPPETLEEGLERVGAVLETHA